MVVHLPRSRVSAIVLAAFVAGLFITLACSDDSRLLGTELTAANPAHVFSLTDQFQRPLALRDLRGKVVAITFLYTNCPDVCPVVAGHLRDTHRLLASEAEEVAILAVSVDPQRDTVEQTLEFSKRWQMEDKWAFLVGTEEELAPIWAAYFIAASTGAGASEHTETSTQSPPAKSGGDASTSAGAHSYLVTHSAPVYLVDREGRMRVVHTLPFEPESLVHDIRMLLTDRP